jgi:hypothetical protein
MTVIWFSETDTSGTLNVSMPGGSAQTFTSTPEFRSELSYHPSEATTSRSNAPYMHRIRVTGLTPSTLYPYTVTQGADVFNGQIRTVPGQSSSVRFMVYADAETEPESTGSSVVWTQPGNPSSTRRYVADQTTGYRENLSVIESRNPDFVGIAGDIVESGGEQRDWDEFWRHNAGDINDLASKVPILPAPGNHEDYGGPGAFGGYGDAGSIRGRDKYATYWETPSNGTPSHTDRYYRVDYGPITYISIDVTNGLPHRTSADTNWLLGPGPGYPDFNPGSVQYQWLEAQLADAQSKSRFTFVQLHHVPYSTGPHGLPAGEGPGFDNQSGQPVRVLTPLFQQYGVDAVFSGHDETYQHSIVNGIHFYDIGIGGDGLRGPSAGPDSANPTINTNPFQVFTAHLNAPEVWNGSQLVSGGKHYGHLEINVSLDSATGTWKAQLDPVHIFPLMNTAGQVTGWERRVYNDSVTLTANAAPTSITLSPAQIAENLPASTPVGNLSSADAAGNTHTYQLVTGDGDADNGSFMVSGNQLIARQSFDFEAKSQYRVRVRTTDQSGLFFEQSLTVNVTNVPESAPPVISGTGGPVTWREDTPPVLLFPAAAIADVDSLNFADGVLTLEYLSGSESSDELLIRSVGTGPGQISTGPSATVLYQGTPIGHYSGGLNGSPFIFNPGLPATRAAVQALLRNLTFRNNSQAPLNPSRTLQLRLSDGDGGISVPVMKSITVTPVNDKPIISAFGDGIAYAENSLPVLVAPTAAVSDVDSANFNSGRLTVAVSANSHTGDRISIRNQGVLAGQIGTSLSGTVTTVTFGGTTIGTATGTSRLSVLLNENATSIAVQALLRNITYANISEAPSILPRTITATLTDGDNGTSVLVSKSVEVTAFNDAPVIEGFGSSLTDQTVIYRENSLPVLIDNNALMKDPDLKDFAGGVLTVTLTQNGRPEDRLTIVHQGDTLGRVGFNPLTGEVRYGGIHIGTATGGQNGTAPLTVTFNAQAGGISVQAVLRAIAFSTISENPSILTRTVRVVVTDGDGGTSNPVSKSIQVISVNDAPVISGFDGNVPVTAGGPPVFIDTDVAVNDVDTATLAGGVLSIRVASNAHSGDRLRVSSVGNGPGQIRVDTNPANLTIQNVFFEGTLIGTFATNSTSSLRITLNAAATPVAVTALLRRVTFQNQSLTATLLPRTISVSLLDGSPGATGTASKSLFFS